MKAKHIKATFDFATEVPAFVKHPFRLVLHKNIRYVKLTLTGRLFWLLPVQMTIHFDTYKENDIEEGIYN